MKNITLQLPLDYSQSERLLQFCLNIGVDCFSVNFVYGNEDELRNMKAIDHRLAPFSLGNHLLEQTTWRNDQRFAQAECWRLNPETLQLILNACDGSLSNYDMGRLPEDWKFYRQGELLLGFVSHEYHGFLRLPDNTLHAFSRIGIAYTPA